MREADDLTFKVTEEGGSQRKGALVGQLEATGKAARDRSFLIPPNFFLKQAQTHLLVSANEQWLKSTWLLIPVGYKWVGEGELWRPP